MVRSLTTALKVPDFKAELVPGNIYQLSLTVNGYPTFFRAGGGEGSGDNDVDIILMSPVLAFYGLW